MIDKLLKGFFIVKQFVNVLLMAISPMALLMLIVGFIMFLDYHGAHQRRKEALEEIPLSITATITSCYEDERYCFADFIDAQGRDRYGKLDWRYYDKATTAKLTSLERGDSVEVRYANEQYENDIVLAGHYDAFLNYKGYIYDMGGIALVSWVILILHPEVMLFALVDDMGTHFDNKWKRMTGQK